MGEFLVQGKHFAATQGKGHFAEDEILDLNGMYATAVMPQTVSDILSKVRATRQGSPVTAGAETPITECETMSLCNHYTPLMYVTL